MKVTLKLYAMLSDYLPAASRGDNSLELEMPEGTRLAQVIERIRLPERLTHLVLVNGLYVAPGDRAGRVLAHGDVVAIWPPIAGG